MTMPPLRRFRAPKGEGELLADPTFDRVPELISRNRQLLDSADVRIDGTPLSQFRQETRQELCNSTGPLILTGHQPELCHPGVWLKTFAAAGLAERLNGSALNLVVDADEVKTTSVKVPVWDTDPSRVRMVSMAFDSGPADVAYESRPIHDVPFFASFPERLAEVSRTWPFEPLVAKYWSVAVEHPGPLGERFVAMRSRIEESFGCRVPTLNVSTMSGSNAFRRFAHHILNDLPRFAASHNLAVREYRQQAKLKSKTHPVPELRDGEAPFWAVGDGRRQPATANSDTARLRPRALTLTLFARLCLGDLFLHGIGGGMYDAVTDAIVRDYFGIEPPAYQVLSGTLRLPFPPFPHTADDANRLAHRHRDLYWNPQRELTHPLVERRTAVQAERPETKAERRRRADEIRSLNEQLRPHVESLRGDVARKLELARFDAHANAVLQSREYAGILFPETTIGPFLQSVMKRADVI
jgi:hypothetical protein